MYKRRRHAYRNRKEVQGLRNRSKHTKQDTADKDVTTQESAD